MFFRQGGPKGTKKFYGVPLSKKYKISVYNFQMYLMAHLKALGILRWNLGSDIEIHDLRSSAMVLIDVGHNGARTGARLAWGAPGWNGGGGL